MTPPMMLPSKKFVERIQARASAYMFVDTATIIYRTVSSYDTYGQVTYTETSTVVSCSFTDKPSKETWGNGMDVENIEAEIRFVGTKPGKGDRVTLSHRFNRDDTDDQDYAAQTFEIVDIRDRDVFGYVLALKKVQI
jgi:hypothetical protein